MHTDVWHDLTQRVRAAFGHRPATAGGDWHAPQGKWPRWFAAGGLAGVAERSAFGATDPLPSALARVGLLNRQPTLGTGDGNYSSCPFPDIT
jgi:hypothetical protein